MVGRTLTSRKRRAETKALHRVLSSPLMHTSADLNSQDETDDIEDDMDDDDPEVLFFPSFPAFGT